MKKLLLTSDALSTRKIKKEFLKLINKPIKSVKVLAMICPNMKSKDSKYERITRKAMRNIGIIKKNIIIVNIRKKY